MRFIVQRSSAVLFLLAVIFFVGAKCIRSRSAPLSKTRLPIVKNLHNGSNKNFNRDKLFTLLTSHQHHDSPRRKFDFMRNFSIRSLDYYIKIKNRFSSLNPDSQKIIKNNVVQYDSLLWLHKNLGLYYKQFVGRNDINFSQVKQKEHLLKKLITQNDSLNSRVKRQFTASNVTTTQETILTESSITGVENSRNHSYTSVNILPVQGASPAPLISATAEITPTIRTPGVIVRNTSQSIATENSPNGSTGPQISVASGKGNKAGVTPSNTTPLSLISNVSHASQNSSDLPENAATSLSNFSPVSDSVTAGTGKPEARSTTDYSKTQTLVQHSSPAGGTVSTAVEPVNTSRQPTTDKLNTKPSKTTRNLTPLKTTGNAETKGEGFTALRQTSGARSKVVTDGSPIDGKTVPEAEPETNKPSSEPEPEGEGEPEPGSVTMANNNNNATEPSPEPTLVPFAEPIPDWVVAKKAWQEAWPIHIYSMGTAFSLLAVFSLISIIRLWRIKHLFSQKYFISLNLLMFLMGVIRGIYLLIDGYNSMELYPRVVDYFLFSTGFPCLTSAFSILFFALLQATRMQLVGPRVQKVQVLIAIIVCHFGISIITDIVVGYFYGARIMLFLCELISVLWGLFLVIGYCYIFRRLYAAALKRQRVMERLSNVRSSRSPGTNGVPPTVSDRKPSRTDSTATVKPSQKYTLSLAVKVTLGTAILGLVYIGLEIYGMFGVFGVFSQSTPEPWPWWGFEFGLRLVELFMCITMSYIGTQPFRYVEGLQTRRWCFYCAACRELVRPRCGSKAGNDHLAWHEINPDLSNSAASEPESALQASRIVYRKRSKSKSPPKTPVPYEVIQMQVKLNSQNGHGGNGVNGHINPSLESGADSRPVSMLVNEDGFIRFRNVDELVIAMSTGGDSLTGDSAELTPNHCANDLVTGAEDFSKTNANTNVNLYDRSMPYGGGEANSEHEHGIVNDGFSGGADSSRNSGVLPDTDTNPVLSLDRLLLADKESDAYSASSMHSYSRSNFSESIEQELQNLIVRKPSLVVEKAKSSTNLPAEIEDSYFTNKLIFTEKSPRILTGVRSPPNERVLQKCSNPTRSMPCSPLKASLESPPDKKKLLSRSNSDHLPLVKHASVRTKVYKNAKYFSLSDLELQIKSDDLGPGLEQVHPPPQFDPVKLISSRKVPESEMGQNGSLVQQEDTIKAKNGLAITTNGSTSPKKTSSKTKKNKDEKSKTGDSDQSEC